MSRRAPLAGPPQPPARGPSHREDGHPGPPAVSAEPAAPPPDVQVTGNRLYLTVELGEIPPDRLAHYLGSNVFVLWHRDAPDRARLLRLPVDIEPREAAIQVTNHVLDLVAPVARRPASAASPDPSRPDESA